MHEAAVSGVQLEGATGCERWASLAEAKGCVAPSGCSVLPACEEEVMALADCAATDLAQCLCEATDRDLNCEGAWKANEGPARCVAEHEAFVACEGL